MNHAAIADTPIQPARDLTRRAITAALIMALAAALAWFLTPTQRLADENPIQLESMIPTAFGDWVVDINAHAGVVNPQQTELINRLYSQTLSRTYINSKTGARVMLSIAYGEDQRDGMQMHYPEVCYPAQGFEVRRGRFVSLRLGDLIVPARELETELAGRRFEPVTYWTVVGRTAVRGGTQKKLVELSYGLRGVIVDGLLFRVSSISRDSAASYSLHRDFATELLSGLPRDTRSSLVGGAM